MLPHFAERMAVRGISHRRIESLKLYTLEEAYEVNQAVTDLTKTGDCANLKEELGDLLFQVLLQSQVAEEYGEFAIEDVIDGIAAR